MRVVTLTPFLLALGCSSQALLPQGADVDSEQPEVLNPSDGAQGRLMAGRLAGSLGRFSVDTHEIHGTADYDANFAHIDLRGRGEGVLMAMIDIFEVDLASLEVGDRISGTGMGDPAAGAMGGPESGVFVIGCAGETDDNWEEDVPSEDVEVVVEEVDEETGTVTMSFEANMFEAEPMTGAFQLSIARD